MCEREEYETAELTFRNSWRWPCRWWRRIWGDRAVGLRVSGAEEQREPLGATFSRDGRTRRSPHGGLAQGLC